jgi:hypothetical protein
LWCVNYIIAFLRVNRRFGWTVNGENPGAMQNAAHVDGLLDFFSAELTQRLTLRRFATVAHARSCDKDSTKRLWLPRAAAINLSHRIGLRAVKPKVVAS